MSESQVLCKDCGIILSDLPNFAAISECPNCGSRNRHIVLADAGKSHERVKVVSKDPSRTGKKKILREVIAGDDLHVDSGKWNEKKRIIDPGNDYYLEEITDPETGEIIYRCEEPLSQHQWHGSAKRKPNI